jgi:regulator of cell morphogenesis and NO signaling
MDITLHQTVGELASASLAAVRVFERHGIDYCCGGKRPLEEACRELGLAPEQVQSEIDRAMAAPEGQGTDWSAAPLPQLVRHILATHHEYLKLELPRLGQRLEKVMKIYGEKDAETLAGLPGPFGALSAELDGHMHKEELLLFPAIERYEAAVSSGSPLPPLPFGSIANPIRVMEREHDSAGNALRQMRDATRGYRVPEHACVTYRSLLDGLRELEADLHKHIHLENNILFPRAIALEAAGG